MPGVLLLLLLAAPARAGVVEEARSAEAAGRWGEAAALWGRCARTGEDPRVEACRGRRDWLEARRSGGDFEVLALLMRARRVRGEERTALKERLAAIPEGALPPALDADVGLWLLAEGEVARGEGLWARHRDGPEALRVGESWARRLVEAGRIEEAAAVEAAVTPASLGRGIAEAGRIERRRGRLAVGAWGVLSAFLLAGLPLAALGLRARRGGLLGLRPLGLVPLLVAVLGGGALAEAWEPGLGRATGALLAGAVGLHGVALLALPSVGGAGRAGLRALAFGATVGMGFLVLRGVGLLDWVGL